MLLTMDVKEALQELADMIYYKILDNIEKYGTNPRRGVNTLKGSNLESSIEVKVASENELVFQIADYYQAIVLGWNGWTRRYKGTWSKAIKNISDWAVKNGLVGPKQNANQVAYAVFKAIQKRGIQARPFLGVDTKAGEKIGEPAVGDPSIVIPFLDKFFEDWADYVFKEIMKETDKYFN